jgi:hypothetical protein|tara:strand:+ start:70 stop:342 length:273 start_codon:yes stop_codon:yes gene_type:complete
MDIEQRSLKYVEFHMFETFDPVFSEQTQIDGLWHDDDGLPRYESVVENAPGQEGNPISYLFPPFDPESDEYDTYNSDDDWSPDNEPRPVG